MKKLFLSWKCNHFVWPCFSFMTDISVIECLYFTFDEVMADESSVLLFFSHHVYIYIFSLTMIRIVTMWFPRASSQTLIMPNPGLTSCASERETISLFEALFFDLNSLPIDCNYFQVMAAPVTMKPSFALVLPLPLIPLISAQVPHWGPCPEPAVQPAFSMKKVSLPCLTCRHRQCTYTDIGS